MVTGVITGPPCYILAGKQRVHTVCIVSRMLLLEQVDDLISIAAPLQTRVSGGELEIDELLGGHVPARISGALCHCHARQNADKVTVGVHVVRNRGPLQRSMCRGRPTL